MEKISWTDCVKNKVLQRSMEEMNSQYTMKQRKANWIGHFLHRNCLLKHTSEANAEGMGRPGIRCKWLLDNLKEMQTYYWNLKEEV
jgi:hypothetical protein